VRLEEKWTITKKKEKNGQKKGGNRYTEMTEIDGAEGGTLVGKRTKTRRSNFFLRYKTESHVT